MFNSVLPVGCRSGPNLNLPFRHKQFDLPFVSGESTVLTSDSLGTEGTSLINEHETNGSATKQRIRGRKYEMDKVKVEPGSEYLGIKLLDDDWYGTTESVKDYLDISKEIIRPDGGPPRWFCPIACGSPRKGSPLLLFLPGMDGIGLGLILHHKALGRIFEVRCMHVPIYDRTPFEGLVKFVEDTVRYEHALSSNKPIYIIGDSLGGCLALAVAARNLSIDLILILANPATSFGRSPLQPLFPFLEALPNELHATIPYLLSFTMGDPLKLAMASVETGLPPLQTLDQLSQSLISLLPRLSILADIIPKETLLWKLKLLKSASSYANSRLHAVKTEVLVLASGKDQMLPSKDEAERLFTLLPNCKVRYFKDHGHTILLEDGISLATIIKGTSMYRRSRKHDHVLDYLPPTMCEFKEAMKQFGWFLQATNPVVLSTLNDGKIVRGLDGIPNEGPVLLVGYHMLMGIELPPLIIEFLKEKKVLVRGIAHPMLFTKARESSLQETSQFDLVKLFGATPVSATNLFRLLSTKAFVLLYPGGAREALHRRGEEYKLFWPEKPEFVRMAARFGATIVPFGVVGEDDIAELLLDYNELMSIPPIRDLIKGKIQDFERLRSELTEEVANQDLVAPVILPKVPGRLYYLFGKPIETRDKMEALKDKENAMVLYREIKSEVEKMISYLKTKREEDPYRGLLERAAYQATWGFTSQVPTFEL